MISLFKITFAAVLPALLASLVALSSPAQAGCVDSAKDYIEKMRKPYEGTPKAFEKCEILLKHCEAICANKSCRGTDKTACTLLCRKEYSQDKDKCPIPLKRNLETPDGGAGSGD